MKTEVLRLKNVCVASALDDFNLTIFEGEALALAGYSDSNNTMVADIITESFPMDSGYAWIYERRVSGRQIKEPRRRGFYRVYNVPTLISNMSIAENIFLHRPQGQIFGFPSKKEQQLWTSIIFEELDLMHPPTSLVKDLTPLQMILVEIICQIVLGAHLVVMEDTWGTFSSSEIERFLSFIQKVKQIGISFLILTYRPESFMPALDRITIMCQGRVIKTFRQQEYRHSIALKMLHNESNFTSVPDPPNRHISGEALRAVDLSAQTLQHLDLTIHNGSVAGLLDYKGILSTEFNGILTGRLPYSGELLINETPFTPLSQNTLHKRKIGIMSFQDQPLFFNLSWPENLAVYYGMYHHKTYGAFADHSRDFAAHYSELLNHLDSNRPLKALAPDQYTLAKLRFLCWLVAEPCFLLLISPMNNADAFMREIIRSFIGIIARSGTGILLISDNPNEINSCCDYMMDVLK